MDRYAAFVGRLTTGSRCACLVAATLLAFAIAAPIAYGRQGMIGIQAVSLAAGVSLFGAIIAVVLASTHRGTPSVVAWVLAGDGIAMAIPLTTGMIVTRTSPALTEAGTFLWIVLFFLVALTTKTLLVAPLAQQPKGSQIAGGSATEGSAAEGISATTTKAGA